MPERWKLECGGGGRRTGPQPGLGHGPKEGATKGLLLSGSWPARALRAAHHSECRLCSWPGVHRSARPLSGGWMCARSCRLLPNKKAGEEESRWSPTRDRKSQVGVTERVRPESRDPPPAFRNPAEVKTTSKVTLQDGQESRAGMGPGGVLVWSLAQGQITSQPSPRSSPGRLRAAPFSGCTYPSSPGWRGPREQQPSSLNEAP